VAIGGPAPLAFTGAIASPSNISLNATTHIVTIADTGFYQITFGLNQITNNATNWQLTINSRTTNVAGYGLGFVSADLHMQSLTVILQVTTNPTTLAITNNSNAIQQLTSPLGMGPLTPATGLANQAVAAYMTIIKLQ
jgi:hypothetical protein